MGFSCLVAELARARCNAVPTNFIHSCGVVMTSLRPKACYAQYAIWHRKHSYLNAAKGLLLFSTSFESRRNSAATLSSRTAQNAFAVERYNAGGTRLVMSLFLNCTKA